MKKSGQQAGNRPVRQGRGTGRADGKTSQAGARNSPGQKKGAGLPNLRDIPPSEQGKFNSHGPNSPSPPDSPSPDQIIE